MNEKEVEYKIYNILDYSQRPSGRMVAKCGRCEFLSPDFRSRYDVPRWNYCPNCGVLIVWRYQSDKQRKDYEAEQ